MAILIHGKDDYRSRERLKEVISQRQKSQAALSIRIFDAENLDAFKLKEELGRVSMFKEKQLFILRDVFSSKALKEEILNSRQFLKLSDTVIFFEKEAISKTDPLYLLIKKTGQVEQLDPLNNAQLTVWVRSRLGSKQVPAKISETSLSLLISIVGNNLWRMANEIDKLASFKMGNFIESEDISALVPDETESVIFDTIDQIASRNAKIAYRSAHRHLDNGGSPFYLLSMISFQFRNLLIVKSLVEEGQPYYSLSKISGIHPFVIRKSVTLSQKFTIESLKKIYQKIFKVDFDIKRGKVEPVTAIDLLIGDICLSR